MTRTETQAKLKVIDDLIRTKYSEWDDMGNELDEAFRRRERFVKRNKKNLTKNQIEIDLA